MDRFKAYNDRYGFARGDTLICHVAESLRQALRACGQPEDFLGHVGGDDFVLAVAPERAEAIAADAIRRFETGLGRHVDPADFARGYVEVADRRRRPVRVPLPTLTIVGVPVSGSGEWNLLKLGEATSELKLSAKRRPGSKLVMDRRGAGTRPEPRAPSEA